MAAQVWLKAKSISATIGNSPSFKSVYFVRGTDDVNEVLALVKTNSPRAVGTMFRQSMTADDLGAGCWDVTVNYALAEPVSTTDPSTSPDQGSSGENQPGENTPIGPAINVQVGHRTQKIYMSLHTVAKYKALNDLRPIPDHRKAIGVSRDGVDGVDIVVPEFTWSEQWKFSSIFITWRYLKVVADLVGRVNRKKFRTFDSESVMFMGAQVDASGTEETKITFNFRYEPNVKNIKINDDFPLIEKKGHQYLWVAYEDIISNNNILKRPRAVYIEEVGRPGGRFKTPSGDDTNIGDFRLLGIGT
ncbi:MAG: hypothetical protein KatS3mg105_5023 [Gemmatales bacterium]|nr:MAG: hypothetical protein KatS3mg105_5023 [Gemmatales bacterium]